MGKSVKLQEITSYLDEMLKLPEFSSDCSNNGLQFEGKKEVKKALRSVVSVKYKIKDREVFDKAYNYFTETQKHHNCIIDAINKRQSKALIITEGSTDWKHIKAAAIRCCL